MKNNTLGAKKKSTVQSALFYRFYLFIQFQSPVEQQLDLFPKTG